MDNINIPYVAFEGALARMERANRRLWIALITILLMLLMSVGAWVYMLTQFDFVSETYTATQDGRGINIFSGGDVSYGAESDR